MTELTPPKYSTFEKYMITITVMLAAIIEILDTTIVNVSLPHMMASFSASTDQITLVLTGYIVSSAILMPLTGLFIRRMGVRRLLLSNIVGFLIASMLCGLSESLAQIVFFRVLQGVFGASLVPLSQYILRNTFEQHEQGKAMAIWGLGIMVGPILGPTLGGHITEALNWRWIFYINLPICIIAFLMTLRFIKESVQQKEMIDWLGLGLMSVSIGSLQIMLDRGQNDNWFDSGFIMGCAITAFITGAIFIYRGCHIKNNIINLSLFKERNFTISTVILSLFVVIFFGNMILQPIMLETLMGYPSDVTGNVMAPRGIASAISMILVARLMTRVDHRVLIGSGILLAAFGTYQMTFFTLNGSMWTYIAPSITQGFAMGLVFVPLSSSAFNYLEQNRIGDAAGLYSFGRSLGSSIGISCLTTMMIHQSQVHWSYLREHIQPANPHYLQWAHAQNYQINAKSTLQAASSLVQRQSEMLGFIDVFWASTFILCLLAILVFFLKKGASQKAANLE
jgi:DHA2 family multidrug resistance protein